MTHGGLIYLKAPCIYMTSCDGYLDKYLDKCPTIAHLYSLKGFLNLPRFLVELFRIIHTQLNIRYIYYIG